MPDIHLIANVMTGSCCTCGCHKIADLALCPCLLAGSVLHLLTVVFGGVESNSAASLEWLVPRLWPLFRHPLSRVRLAAVQCLQTFLPAAPHSPSWLTNSILQTALRLHPKPSQFWLVCAPKQLPTAVLPLHCRAVLPCN